MAIKKTKRKIFKNAIEILRKNKFTKGAYAKNNFGKEVPPCDEYATAFCMGGALMRATGVNFFEQKPFPQISDILFKELGGEKSIHKHNDKKDFTKRKAINALKRAHDSI